MSDGRFDTKNLILKKSSNAKKNKIKLDPRFKDVLTDDRFVAAPGQVDKYGRKPASSAAKGSGNDFSEFYEVEDDVDKDVKKSGKAVAPKSKDEDRLDYLTRLARGEVSADSSDEEDNDDDVVETELEENEDNHGPLDVNGSNPIELGESTARIALQNCDWDNLKAEDLM